MRNRNRPNYGITLLLWHIFGTVGVDRIPPVTMAAVVLQVIVYLRLIRLPWYEVSDVCLSLDRVWYGREWQRLIFAAIEHADDIHLYYNMVSFVWKGQQLERRWGSLKFFYILCVFTVLTNVALLALSHVASEYFDPVYRYHCAVGFSGVIFALKVLTNYYRPQTTVVIYGLPLPAAYAVWLELVLIQLVVPGASFLGHLAGILVGVCYAKGPLKPAMDAAENLARRIFRPAPDDRYRFRYAGDEDSGLSAEEIRRRRLFRFNYAPTTRN
ncbi:rhomboid-related protein 4-like [Centruroides sculpturatus]|uniref:rhomboid-related protein 4-like n=1 Tax=Centruroides sculpturatus TaxID=218467 RepID=UPI000C6EFB46|nr:rhomboid-related protein 4-like [Centruroides sculpturatus]XP_023241731.1 rhomboid-related protein 4-like [Centruroides sculpturatus]XP_023241732.1 rhomboid-related protein 4-like [Centruroides sculpturatus]XP_023241733.1 rhomboid-related protein 4-like [Centruroides sculpturatus]XP_023241734.1 rhomboid-related protein 4-like [Centruroides sculpturatus]